MRFAIDSNILVYAVSQGDRSKHEIAREIMIRAPKADCVLPVQAIGEFLNVIRRRYAEYFEDAFGQATRWARTFVMLETNAEHILAAAEFAERHKLQLWDSIIWQVARSAGVETLISEDLQDRLSIDGTMVMNPFNPANDAVLRALLQNDSSNG